MFFTQIDDAWLLFDMFPNGFCDVDHVVFVVSLVAGQGDYIFRKPMTFFVSIRDYTLQIPGSSRRYVMIKQVIL